MLGKTNHKVSASRQLGAQTYLFSAFDPLKLADMYRNTIETYGILSRLAFQRYFNINIAASVRIAEILKDYMKK